MKDRIQFLDEYSWHDKHTCILQMDNPYFRAIKEIAVLFEWYQDLNEQTLREDIRSQADAWLEAEIPLTVEQHLRESVYRWLAQICINEVDYEDMNELYNALCPLAALLCWKQGHSELGKVLPETVQSINLAIHLLEDIYRSPL